MKKKRKKRAVRKKTKKRSSEACYTEHTIEINECKKITCTCAGSGMPCYGNARVFN